MAQTIVRLSAGVRSAGIALAIFAVAVPTYGSLRPLPRAPRADALLKDAELLNELVRTGRAGNGTPCCRAAYSFDELGRIRKIDAVGQTRKTMVIEYDEDGVIIRRYENSSGARVRPAEPIKR